MICLLAEALSVHFTRFHAVTPEWPDEDHRSRTVFIARGISSKDLLGSLEAFQGVIGAKPRLLEANTAV